MQALMYFGQRNIQLKNIDIPVPQKDEVLIRVTGAGLCQTQVNEFIEGPYIINKIPHKFTGNAIPIVVGHEFGGIIEKVGNPELDSHLIGLRAAVLPLLKCGQCTYCEKGLENLCENIAYYGLIGGNGGFAEYASVKRSNIFLVNDSSILTFIEPLLVAIHAGRKVKNNIIGKKICILGAGAIGICTAAVFRDYFGGDVVINDILPGHLERAKKAGFDVIKKEDIKPEYDIVIDCAGNNPISKSSAFIEGYGYLRKTGVLINIGTYFHSVSLVPSAVLVNEHHMITSYLYDYSDIELLNAVIDSIKIDFSSLIFNIELKNIIEDGYYRFEVDKDSFTRLVVVP